LIDRLRRRASPPAAAAASVAAPVAPPRVSRIVFLGDSLNTEHYTYLFNRLSEDADPTPEYKPCPTCPEGFAQTSAAATFTLDSDPSASVEVWRVQTNDFRGIPEAFDLRPGDVVVASFAAHFMHLSSLASTVELFLATISQPRFANVTFFWKEAAPTHFPVSDGTWHTYLGSIGDDLHRSACLKNKTGRSRGRPPAVPVAVPEVPCGCTGASVGSTVRGALCCGRFLRGG
jgi:hypothetical protein